LDLVDLVVLVISGLVDLAILDLVDLEILDLGLEVLVQHQIFLVLSCRLAHFSLLVLFSNQVRTILD
tara:strand:- start:262 stop:462 length:201 start_codon:yes stop_codon:yes gene_type:complete